MRFALLMLVALASVAAAVISDPNRDSYRNYEFVNLENLVHRLRVEPAKLTDSDFSVVASAVARCEKSMEGISLGTKLSEYLLQDNSKKNSLDICPNWVDFFRGWIGKPKSMDESVTEYLLQDKSKKNSLDVCPNWVEYFRGWIGKSKSMDESVTQVMALLCIADCGLADDPEFVAVVADFLTRDDEWYANTYGATAVLLLAKRMEKASLEMTENPIRRAHDAPDAYFMKDRKLKTLLEDVVEEVLSKLSADDLALVPKNIPNSDIPVFVDLAWVAINKLSAQQLQEFQQRMSKVLEAMEWAELFRGRFRNSHNDVDSEAVRNAIHSSKQARASEFINAVQLTS